MSGNVIVRPVKVMQMTQILKVMEQLWKYIAQKVWEPCVSVHFSGALDFGDVELSFCTFCWRVRSCTCSLDDVIVDTFSAGSK